MGEAVLGAAVIGTQAWAEVEPTGEAVPTGQPLQDAADPATPNNERATNEKK